MKSIPLKGLKLGLCLAALSLTLAGCGRNGAPLPPPGISEDKAQPYLNENTSGSLNQDNSAEEKRVQQDAASAAGQTAQPPTEYKKTGKTFFLDPLL